MGHGQKSTQLLQKQIQTAKQLMEQSQSIDDTLMMGNLLENLESQEEKYAQVESPCLQAAQQLQSLLTCLDIFILEKKHQARPLAEYIMKKHYRDLALDENYLKKFKKLLLELQEQEKKYMQTKSDSSHNVDSAQSALKQIRVLMADISCIKEARKAMDQFVAYKLYEELEENTLKDFLSLRESLSKREKQAECNLQDKENQEKRNKILYKRCLDLQKDNKDLKDSKKQLEEKLCKVQDSYNHLQKEAEKTEHYKRLAATILADVFRQDPEKILSRDRICMALMEYEKSSPDGFSPSLTPCLREAILTQLQYCLEPYEKLAQEDFI